jgi:hypothetical protein
LNRKEAGEKFPFVIPGCAILAQARNPYPQYQFEMPGYKSTHPGFSFSIRRIFQSRRHFFNSFSQAIAVAASS